MAPKLIIPVVCCLLVLQCQASSILQSKRGLALPDSMPMPRQQVATVQLEELDTQGLSALEEAYLDDFEWQEMEKINNAINHDEQQMEQQAELEIYLPELMGAHPQTSAVQVSSVVEQAKKIAAQLMSNKNLMQALSGVSTGSDTEVDGIVSAPALGNTASDGIVIDMTVTTERNGAGWMLPSVMPNMQSMFGLFGSDNRNDNAADREAALAAKFAESVVQSLSQPAGTDGKDIVLEMTLDNPSPHATEKLVAAATAAAASAAASAALNQQPLDDMELQLEVVQTNPWRGSPFYMLAMLLLSVQLMLCVSIAFTWATSDDEDESDEEEDEQDDAAVEYVEINLKEEKEKQQRMFQQQQQQPQQQWASLAEEGRGIYESLLSYT